MASSIKLLIVDDSDLKRVLLVHHLLKHFPTAQFVQCNNGAEAIEQLKLATFDAVVTDNNMVPVNGIDLILWIRSNFAHFPIVMGKFL